MTIPPITHTPVTSSNVQSYGYHPETQTLEVRFRGGATYQYHGITHAQVAHLKSAESVGSWVHTHLVKPKHPHTKL